jgi:hypothetical protein
MKIALALAALGAIGFAAYLYQQGDHLTASSPLGASTNGTPWQRITLGWANTFGS